MNSQNELRTCSKCGKEKPLDGFYRNNTYEIGRSKICILCEKAYKKSKVYVEKQKKRHAEYRAKNKEILLEKNRKYYDTLNAKQPWKKHFQYIRNRSRSSGRKRYFGIEVSITELDLKKFWFRDNASSLKRPSVDRIDNERGYTKDNCRFIELSGNSRKGKLALSKESK